jgi:hypothetical protein
MKAIYLLYALSFGAAIATGAGTSSASSASSGQDDRDTQFCPPNTYDCCDGSISSICTANGGICGIETICGRGV